MKVVFFNRFFFPDQSATAQILSDLAFHVAAGHEVHVVTSGQAAAPMRTEVVRGVIIHRVAIAAASRGILAQAFAYARYLLGARKAMLSLASAGDIVVLKTDPPMLSAFLGPIAKARRARLVVWLQDLFPEVAIRFGIPGLRGPLGRYLQRRRDHSLSIADAVVAIGEGMAERLRRLHCIDPRRVRIIHNWSDGTSIRPMPRDANPLREAWGLGNRFVVAYSGNLGRVHEFETLLGAARHLRHDRGIVFLIIGSGPRLPEVLRRLARDQLDNVITRPAQAREALVQSLCTADVHISILRPEFEGLVVPSKLYGIMAAGRPTVFIGSADDETATILRDTGAGTTVATGDADALARVLRRIRDDDVERGLMGERARAAFETRFDRHIAFSAWDALFHDLSQEVAESDPGIPAATAFHL
jgi:glycosyltransferase involved in cell wall biosynthesis